MSENCSRIDSVPAAYADRESAGGTTSAAVVALRWLTGAGLLAAVIVAAFHFSEGRAFARLVEQANPWWLLTAVSLQALTYLAQAEVFRSVPPSIKAELPRGWSYRLSLAKLFADQAVPSAGLSGTAVLAAAFRARGIPRRTTAAVAIVTIASYHTAYVVCLVMAMGLAASLGLASPVIVITSAMFLAFGVGMTTAVLALAGRTELSRFRVARWNIARRIVSLLADADPALARRPATVATATAWQLAIFLLDAATMWALIRALGVTAPAGAVFASLIIASVFRTMSIVPGGLGAYEAASVITLKLLGIDVSVALSATLLFRGLSFWLPMLPGFWYSRRVVLAVAPRGTSIA